MIQIWIILLLSFLNICGNISYADDGYARGSGFNEGDLRMQKYSVQSHEMDATPVSPPTDEIKLYACDDAGTTKMCTVDSLGAVTTLGSGGGTVSDAIYGAGWDGVTTIAPSKNAVYDKIETIASGGDNIDVNSTGATNANFLDNLYIDWALNAASTPDDITGKFNYAETLAGNPALLTTEVIFTADGLLAEGTTADTIEMKLVFPDPATTDKTLTLPNETGTICSTGSVCSGYQATLTNHTNIIYVGKHGNDSNNGLTPNSAKLTVAAGITASSSGSIIYVFPGTYTENGLPLKDGTALVGADWDNTKIVDAPSAGVLTSGNGIVNPAAGTTYIANITLSDTNNVDSVAYTSGVAVNNANSVVYITHCRINGAYDGVFGAGDADNIDMIIRDSVITGDYDGVTNYGDTGSSIEIYNSSIVVAGTRLPAGTPERAVVVFTGAGGGTTTSAYIYNTYMEVTTDNSGGDVGGVWAGKQTANTSAGIIFVVNSYIKVTGIAGADAHGAFIQSTSSSSTVDIYNTKITVSGGDNNYAFTENAGTLTAGGITTTNSDSGTITYLDINVPTEIYDATGWNGDNTVPTKDAVRDKIESLSSGGAPTTVDYLVGTADATLSAEIVVGAVPGGELGNTWASPTIDDSLAVTSWNLTTPILSGKTNADGSTVNDDDCTGEQGSFWFDDTDLAFEFCNANSGIPTTLSGGGSDTNANKEYWFDAAAMSPLEAADSIPPLTKTSGTNVDILSISYDAATDEGRQIHIKVPSDVSSGSTITFRIVWFSLTATTGDVIWDIRYQSTGTTAESWDQTLTTKAASAATTQGTVNQRTVTTVTETLANLGWAANDDVYIMIYRDANNASDTMAGDAEVIGVGVEIPRS